MAYSHNQIELISPEFTAATTGDKAEFAVGFVPIIVRAVGVLLNAAPADAGVIAFDKRVTYESDTGRVNGGVATVNLATTHAAGSIVYVDGLSVKLLPGEEIVVEVTDASAGVTVARAFVWCEYSWEVPANNPKLVRST